MVEFCIQVPVCVGLDLPRKLVSDDSLIKKSDLICLSAGLPSELSSGEIGLLSCYSEMANSLILFCFSTELFTTSTLGAVLAREATGV